MNAQKTTLCIVHSGRKCYFESSSGYCTFGVGKKVCTVNSATHYTIYRYGSVVKKAKLVFLGFCAFGDWKRKLSVCCGTEKWKVSWKATVERNKKEKINKKTKNLDADCSGLCSFGADGSSAESAWILSLTVFALWLRPTRNGSESLEFQARKVKKNWSFLFLKWKWILLGNGSKFWK